MKRPKPNESNRVVLDAGEALLEFFRNNQKPWRLAELGRKLPVSLLSRLGKRGLEDKLFELVDQGKLSLEGQTFSLQENMRTIIGRFEATSGNFGFVIPETPGLPDIFVPGEDVKTAWDGDKVAVRLGPKRRGDESPPGNVARILKRARDQIVGTLGYWQGYAVLRPDETKLPGSVFLLPVENLAEGARLLVKLHWPENTGEDEPFGELIEVLGESDSPEIETRAVIIKYGLSDAFRPDTLAEAAKIPKTIPKTSLRGRTDLRGKRVFTIDGVDAKDFDDAIHIEPLASGNFLVGVHIADVSHYVPEGSALDLEAKARSTSVYLPGKVLPMLPEKLSNGVCSLVEGEDRLTISALLELTPDGSMTDYKLVKSVICSRARLTYEEVQAFADSTKKPNSQAVIPEKVRELENDLQMLLKLTNRLRQNRFRQGSLDFHLKEVRVELGEKLNLIPIAEETARGLIEDLMLLANKVVATEFNKRGAPTLFRVHEEPSKERFLETTNALGRLGLSVRGGQPSPQAYQEILASVRGTQQESIVSTLLLRSLRQARYSRENLGHFGLAFSDYLHFTSPIRRYPDLIVHRVLKRILDNKLSVKKKEDLEETLPELAAHTSERERMAVEAERDLTKYYQAKWAQTMIGMDFDAVVSGVTPFGFFVALENSVEGLVRLSTLRDYYTFLPEASVLRAKGSGQIIRLGTQVRVRIAASNPIARQIDLELDEKSLIKRKEIKPKEKILKRRIIGPDNKSSSNFPKPIKVKADKLYFDEWLPNTEKPIENPITTQEEPRKLQFNGINPIIKRRRFRHTN